MEQQKITKNAETIERVTMFASFIGTADEVKKICQDYHIKDDSLNLDFPDLARIAFLASCFEYGITGLMPDYLEKCGILKSHFQTVMTNINYSRTRVLTGGNRHNKVGQRSGEGLSEVGQRSGKGLSEVGQRPAVPIEEEYEIEDERGREWEMERKKKKEGENENESEAVTTFHVSPKFAKMSFSHDVLFFGHSYSKADINKFIRELEKEKCADFLKDIPFLSDKWMHLNIVSREDVLKKLVRMFLLLDERNVPFYEYARLCRDDVAAKGELIDWNLFTAVNYIKGLCKRL